MARILLIDTLFHIFRSYHALPPMNAPDGSPTNAVHGVLNVLAKLWRTHHVDGMVLVFESREGVFREGLDENYKATRAEADVDLRRQIPLVEEAARCLGLQTISRSGFEADDVIATLARLASQAGHEAIIVSNDKDMAQMLRWPGVRQLKLRGAGKNGSEEWIGSAEVGRDFGVPPERIADWLALVGDTVDNIPGLKGVGPKTASKLLNDWGSLEGLLAWADREGPACKWNLADPVVQERLRLNLRLTTARDDLDVEFDIEDFRPHPFQGLEAFYERMGMKRSLSLLQQTLFEPTTVADLWR